MCTVTETANSYLNYLSNLSKKSLCKIHSNQDQSHFLLKTKRDLNSPQKLQVYLSRAIFCPIQERVVLRILIGDQRETFFWACVTTSCASFRLRVSFFVLSVALFMERGKSARDSFSALCAPLDSIRFVEPALFFTRAIARDIGLPLMGYTLPQ